MADHHAIVARSRKRDYELNIVHIVDRCGTGIVGSLVVVPLVLILVPLVLTVMHPDLRHTILVAETLRLDSDLCHARGWCGAWREATR